MLSSCDQCISPPGLLQPIDDRMQDQRMDCRWDELSGGYSDTEPWSGRRVRPGGVGQEFEAGEYGSEIVGQHVASFDVEQQTSAGQSIILGPYRSIDSAADCCQGCRQLQRVCKDRGTHQKACLF